MSLAQITLCFCLMALVMELGSAKCLEDKPEVNPKQYFSIAGVKNSLRIDSSRRIGHNITSNILKIFLDEVLGYESVEIQERDYYFNASEAISNLNISRDTGAHINLEVWVRSDYKAPEHISDVGALIAAGRFGWFAATKTKGRGVNDSDSVDWRDLQKGWETAQFAVAKEDMDMIYEAALDPVSKKEHCRHPECRRGVFVPEQCRAPPGGSECATLLAGYYGPTSFVIQHIKELRLMVSVAWVGPNLISVTSQLMDKYRDGNRTTLVLTWTPSTVVESREWTPVAFPPVVGCDERDKKPSCAYAPLRPVKLVSTSMYNGAPSAYMSIADMHLSMGDYRGLLRDAIDHPDKSHYEVACHWMRRSEAKWLHWKFGAHNEFNIAGIFPLSGEGYVAPSVKNAAVAALDAVNRNDSVLRGIHLQMNVDNGQCNTEAVMSHYIQYILHHEFYSRLIGIVGPACSDTIEPLIGTSKLFRTVVVSYSAEGSVFSDRDKYPYFFRTIGENQQFNWVYLNLLRTLGWKRIASLTEDAQKYTEYLPHLGTLLSRNNFTFVANSKFPRKWNNQTMMSHLEELKAKRARIIVADVYDAAARAVMCAAYRLKMTAQEGYVWFLPQWLDMEWYNTDKHSGERLDCTPAEMTEAINGYFTLAQASFAPDDAVMQEGITVGQWKRNFEKHWPLSHYVGYAYDAVWVYALAFDKLYRENQFYLADIHAYNATQKFVQYIQETDFLGVSGHIKFGSGTSRRTVINIHQWVGNKTKIVGTYSPDTSDENAVDDPSRFQLNVSEIAWLTADGKQPDDGEEGCIVYSLALLLSVECSVAIAIANVIGFTVLGILVIIAFLITKHRYDKKMEKMQHAQQYIKSLGFDLLETNLSELDKWEIPRDRVVINRKLGEGAFGMVYGGEAFFPDLGWVAAAVKTLKVNSTTEQKLDFLSEAEVMKRFEHKNIIKLLGVCTKDEPVYTVMEFMLYGDLKTFLLARRHLVSHRRSQHEESEDVSSKKLTTMALDVARGLSYLAELKYVHRDIACRNCLVNNVRVVKIGDFGMTRRMVESDYYKFSRKGMLPVRWMAPESLALGLFKPCSDVWSYGVLLYEIITFGNFPFQGLSNSQVVEHVKQGNTLAVPSGVKPQLECLMKSCWNLDHRKRPQASEIVEFLANNQRLLSPCLDVPISSVEMEDTGQLELGLPDDQRKYSVTLSGRLAPEDLRHPSLSHESDPSPSPHAPDLDSTVFFGNGSADSRVPLLQQARAPSVVGGLGRLLPSHSQSEPGEETSVL